mgnify:FL=1
MKKLGWFLLNLLIYLAIVALIVWGLPQFLSWKLGTQYPIAAITSGSMWPALKEDDIVLIKKIPKEEIKVGDIVVWTNDKGFTIHRVVKLNPNTLVTKGDANFAQDPPVKYEEIVGRTVYWKDSKPLRIPYFGYIAVISGKWRGGQK